MLNISSRWRFGDNAVLKCQFDMLRTNRLLRNPCDFFPIVDLNHIPDDPPMRKFLWDNDTCNDFLTGLLIIEAKGVVFPRITNERFTFPKAMSAVASAHPQQSFFGRVIAFRCASENAFVDVKVVL
jgi:hypothetical protein